MIPVNQRVKTLISRMSRISQIGQSPIEGLDEELTAVSCHGCRLNENRACPEGEAGVATIPSQPAKSEVFNVSMDKPAFLSSEQLLNTSPLSVSVSPW